MKLLLLSVLGILLCIPHAIGDWPYGYKHRHEKDAVRLRGKHPGLPMICRFLLHFPVLVDVH